MAPNEIHKNDIGTVFEVTVKDGTDIVDLSSATELELLFLKPNGTKLTKTASLVSDGTDGKMQYTTVSGDLNASGTWKLQGHVVFGSTGEWHSDTIVFEVYDNL